MNTSSETTPALTRLQQIRPSKRRWIQLYAALLYNAHIRGFIDGEIYMGKAKALCVPGFNCYSCPGAVASCPLGALQNALASSGTRTGFYMYGTLLLFGLILGRTICGWLCPLGLIQELLHKIPTPKIRKSRATRILSYLKYVILAIFAVAIPLWFGIRQGVPVPGFCKYICPAGTSEGAMALLANPKNAAYFSMLNILFTRKFVIMLGIGLACIFCYRSFCRFLCPLGAIYGMFSRIAVVGVKVNTDRCSHCGSCVRHCKMDVRKVGDHECIHCAKCIDVCKKDALSLKAGSYTLAGPEGIRTNRTPGDPGTHRRRTSRIAAAAIAVLAFSLVWFNFLDPSLKQSSAAPAVSDVSVGNEPGMQLEDFTIECLDGSTFHLSEERGKVVIINLWATYCAACVQELPLFSDLYLEHQDDLSILAVHNSMTLMDTGEYLADKDWAMPVADDTSDNLIWNIVGGDTTMPQTIVLNRDGVVTYNQKGSVTKDILDALYEEASAQG